ncbi:MAG: trimethylamine methyltransferase family protein [Bacillota bacterium]
MDEQLRKIHEASMNLLENVGVKFHCSDILNLLESKGIKISGSTAFFTRGQILEWISKAPSSFQIHARNDKFNMLIGGDHSEYISANSGFPLIADAHGNSRLAMYDDYLNFLKLVHESQFFKINGGVMVIPADLKPNEMYPLMLYTTLIHSDKCIFGGLGGFDETNLIMDILGLAFGGKERLQEAPRIITIISPLSPLQFDKTMLDTLKIYAQNRQPIIVAPAVMAGSTGPVTLAGTIALANAECLAGIAVAQMVQEGTPVVYGSASSGVDMRSGGFTIGTPDSALCVAFCARLARAYGLPSRGGGTLNDAKSISVQAGYESMMVMLTSGQEKINFILHSAGSLDSYRAMSYEKFIVDLEIISMVDRYVKGLKIDEETLAIDVIKQVGPGGEFLTHEHTFEHFREGLWASEISLQGVVKGEDPNEKLLSNIRQKRDAMLQKYKRPQFPEHSRKQISSLLRDRGFNVNLIESLI